MMQPLRGRSRAVGVAGSGGAVCGVTLVLWCGGCGTVDPVPDYERARDLIKASTGQERVYTPDAQGLTEEEAQAILAEGLTQKEAIQIAMLNNRELQAAFYDIGVARADWAQSGLLANPTISTSLRFPSDGDSSDFLGAFSQNIADIWQIPMRKQVAAGLVDQAVMRVAGTGNTIAANVRRAYQAAVTAEEMASLAENNAQRAGASVELVRGRQDPASPALDVDMVQGDALRAELAALQARARVSVTRHELARLLSLAMLPDDVVLTDRPGDTGPVPLPAEKAVAVARAKRVDLRAAGKVEAAAQAQITAEYLKILPTFNVGLDLEREPQVEDSKGTLAQIRDEVRSTIRSEIMSRFGGGTVLPLGSASSSVEPKDELSLGPLIAVTLPIFDQNLAQIAKAKILAQKATKQRELLEANVGHDVAIQHNRAELATRNVAFYRDRLLPQAECNLESAAADYQSGKTSAMALLDAQRMFFDARIQHLEAQRVAVTAMSDLEQAVGAPLAVAATMPAEELAPQPAPGESLPILSLPLQELLPSTTGKSSLIPVVPGVNLPLPELKMPALPGSIVPLPKKAAPATAPTPAR